MVLNCVFSLESFQAVEVHASHGSQNTMNQEDHNHHEDIHHSFWSKQGHIGGHVEHLRLFEEEESAAGHLSEGAAGMGSGSLAAGHHGGHLDKTYLWRSVAVIGALYLFFIFETLMHQSIDHRHTHSLAVSCASNYIWVFSLHKACAMDFIFVS